jgi:hypothetical protein
MLTSVVLRMGERVIGGVSMPNSTPEQVVADLIVVIEHAVRAMRTVGCINHFAGRSCMHVDCSEVGIALDECEETLRTVEY